MRDSLKWCVVVISILFATSVLAQDADKPAAPGEDELAGKSAETEGTVASPSSGEFAVTVKELKGMVKVKPAGNSDWVPAVVGMRFGEGSSVCTGFLSAVLLQFGDMSVVLLKDLTQVVVDKLLRDTNAVEAKMSMGVGRAKVFVKKQEVRAEFRVSTPRMTAAVKGSFADLETSPDYGDTVHGASGDVQVTNQLGETTDYSTNAPSGDERIDTIGQADNSSGESYDSPARQNEQTRESQQPAFGGDQLAATAAQLAAMGYPYLGDYLINDGGTYSAVSDLSWFVSEYGSESPQTDWVWQAMNSSLVWTAHGRGAAVQTANSLDLR